MPANRSGGRNVYFYDASVPAVRLGGLVQNGCITEANFLQMLGMLLITESPIRVVQRAPGHAVLSSDHVLQLGEYDVYCHGQIEVTNELWVARIMSHIVKTVFYYWPIHKQFDQYLISVNPDDDYKVVSFNLNPFGLDGRKLDPACLNPTDPHRVSDQLLRWHFRQCVLANMRGAGEPIFEDDFRLRLDCGAMSESIYEQPFV
ncbi:hypothetical protein DFH27DRAFT_600048 [Peziza echinospora]|nr:hypothetical protein DFH27DRAFT_600048 [Peziza echinospora]